MKKTIIIEVRFTVGDDVWYMSGKGIPRRGKVVGFYVNTERDFQQYIVSALTTYMEFDETQLFETREELLAKKKVITPSDAKKLLEKHKKSPVWYVDAEAELFLIERAHNPKK